jgi:putative ABC transport system permease protein
LTRKDRGFDSDRVLTVRVAPQLPATVDRAKAGAWQSFFAEYFSDLTERIERVSGVASAAVVSSVPLAGVAMGLSSVSVDGTIMEATEKGSLATHVASVSPRYFSTMGTSFVSGRDFARDDRMGSPLVAIVNDAFRQRIAPGRDLVGSRVTYDHVVLTIVGVVADVPDHSLRDTAKPLLFTPLAQMPAGAFGWGQLTVVVRTRSLDPRAIAALVQREIWTTSRTAVIDELSSMDERVAVSVRSERQTAWLFGLFAVAALSIAAIGVYGVASYAMAQRTKEIGIRLALGAGRADLSKLVVSQALDSTIAGIGLGAIGAGLATRLIAAGLYGVTALDPRTFVGAAVVLVSIAIAASYLPARKAMRVDPLVALRTE